MQLITKVKAHMTKEQAVSRGEEEHFEGNDLADKMANEALPVYHAKQQQSFFDKEKRHRDKLNEGLDKLIEAQASCPDMFTFDTDKKLARFGYRPSHRHEFR